MGLFCRIIEPQLTAFEAGGLPEWRRTVVGQHLASCERCREEWERQANLSALLRDHPLAAAEPPADLWARLQPQLAVREVAVRRRPLWLAPVAGASFCALVGVSYAAKTGLIGLGHRAEHPTPIVVAKLDPPVIAPTPKPRSDGKESLRDLLPRIQHEVKGDPFESSANQVANADPAPQAGTGEAQRLQNLQWAINRKQEEHRRNELARRRAAELAATERHNALVAAMESKRQDAARHTATHPIRVANLPPRLSGNPDTADMTEVTPRTDLQGTEPDAGPIGFAPHGGGSGPASLPGVVSRGPSRPMPGDMTGAASTANRQPTEAISYANYQRSLFR